MNSEIRIGHTSTLKASVQSDNTIVLGNDPRAEVYSTPSMIHLMEHAAREALASFLETGEESVGIDVQVKHLAATPPRNEVRATATITAVEKNTVSFDVEAHDAWEKIGSGTHRRAVIRTDRIAERVRSKTTGNPGPKPGAPRDRNTNSGSADRYAVAHDRDPVVDLSGLDWNALKFLRVHREGRLLRVQLDRPARKNAINESLTHELTLLVEWLSQNAAEVGVVILSGSGDNFSTGDDVSELAPAEIEKMKELSLLRGAVYSRLANLPQVSIAAIDGFALGGGLVLAAACDFRVATHNARLGLPEVSLGWPPNYGIDILRSKLGRSTALQWSVTGQHVAARQAAATGFVQQVVSRSRLLPTALEIGQKILANSPDAVRAIKQTMQLESTVSDQNATAAFLECLNTDYARRSLEKFSR